MTECSEKCVEYQQVAALMSLDLDLLQTISKRKDITAEELREHIQLTIEKRDDAINNAESRKQRYNMSAMLFNLPLVNAEEDLSKNLVGYKAEDFVDLELHHIWGPEVTRSRIIEAD